MRSSLPCLGLMIAAMAGLAGLAATSGSSLEPPHSPPDPPRPDASHDESSVDGEAPRIPATKSPSVAAACATGCSVGNHPITPLREIQFRTLLDQLAGADIQASTAALETLLFHGAQARRFIAARGAAPLAEEQALFLRRELSKTHAKVWLRLVDEKGVVRASVNGARFPFGEKKHIPVIATQDLPTPEISGTVHRTGLHHLWTRL